MSSGDQERDAKKVRTQSSAMFLDELKTARSQAFDGIINRISKQLKLHDNEDEGKETVKKILELYNLQAGNDDIVSLFEVATITDEKERKVKLTKRLEKCTLKTKLTALQLIRQSASHMYGTRFYTDTGSEGQISSRLPFPNVKILESDRVESIIQEISQNDGTKTIVIGGPSGTGKTCMILGLGNRDNTMMVVYICSAAWKSDIQAIKVESGSENAAKDKIKSDSLTEEANAPMICQENTSLNNNMTVKGNLKDGAADPEEEEAKKAEAACAAAQTQEKVLSKLNVDSKDAPLAPTADNDNTNVDGKPKSYASPEEEEARKARDKKMLDRLVKILRTIIPSQILKIMSNKENEWLPTEKLNVVVALDEMGNSEFAEAVRAMCSLTGSHVRDDINLSWTKDHITVHLAVVGTGLGSGEAPVGSASSKYKVLFANENDERDNETIFGHHFLSAKGMISIKPNDDKSKLLGEKRPRFPAERVDVKDTDFYSALTNLLSPLLQALIRSNSRMAAIIGHKLFYAMKAFNYPLDLEKIIDFADLDSLFYEAAVHFKILNGLDKVSFDDIWELLVFSLRLHYFPLGKYHNISVKKLQVKFGLVVDRMKWGESDFGSSRYELPTFTILLLAKLSGVKVVTKSLISGASFEEYVLAVVHLLACAAGNVAWFRLALLGSAGEGELEPLNYHCAAGENWPYEHKVDKKKNDLPAQDKHCQVSFAQDLSDLKVGKETGIPGLVADILKKKMPLGRKSKHNYIASFRSPDKAMFADVFVFVEDELFLFQCKDHQDSNWLFNVHYERWKMGATDDDAVIAFFVFHKYLTSSEKSASMNVDITNAVTARQAAIQDQFDTAYKAKKASNDAKIADSKTQKAKIGKSTEEARQAAEVAKNNAEEVKKVAEEKFKKAAEKAAEGDTLHHLLVKHRTELQKASKTAASTGCAWLKYFYPTDTLSELSLVWKKATGNDGGPTGIELKKINRCFITPNPVAHSLKSLDNIFQWTAKGLVKFGANAANEYLTSVPQKMDSQVEEVVPGEFFISTHKLQFLMFNTSRDKDLAYVHFSRIANLESYKEIAEKYTKNTPTDNAALTTADNNEESTDPATMGN